MKLSANDSHLQHQKEDHLIGNRGLILSKILSGLIFQDTQGKILMKRLDKMKMSDRSVNQLTIKSECLNLPKPNQMASWENTIKKKIV